MDDYDGRIVATTNGTYLIRVVYDFKTNRIIAAWVPQGTIEVTDDRTLNADVLFVRKENEEVPQIKLANEQIYREKFRELSRN